MQCRATYRRTPDRVPVAEGMELPEDGLTGGPFCGSRSDARNRSEPGHLDEVNRAFLHGCGLPRLWGGHANWCVLETDFGLGLNFLTTWAAWKADPVRPRLLHFVSTTAIPTRASDVLDNARAQHLLQPLAKQLQSQLWGLLPGFHRLVFEHGHVLLTLCIGDTRAMLRGHSFQADSVYLAGFGPTTYRAAGGDVHTIKALARCCRRGTRIAGWPVAASARHALVQCGFTLSDTCETPPEFDSLTGEYQPAWALKVHPAPPVQVQPARCIVIGSGLAGAAAAASLARRGWQVTVLDKASQPGAGASGLPAGVLAAHVSPDDSILSRLSRSGVRMMLQQADSLLKAGAGWSPTGVLEHCIEHDRRLPASWKMGQPLADSASEWTTLATAEQLNYCALPADTPALWHVRAGWIKPARMVAAWLETPGVTWQGDSDAKQLLRQSGQWRVLDATGQVLAQAELVVLAAGYGSAALADSTGWVPALALQPIRGQATWGFHEPATAHTMPPFPVNGYGSLVPAVPGDGAIGWVIGSTFERDSSSVDIRLADHEHNFSKLRTLLPVAAQALEKQRDRHQVHGWAGIRCATPSRLPSLGSLENVPNVWISSGMGSRGLSFAALCAELLAARLHGEPLPLERRLADSLLPQYLQRKASPLKT